MLGRWNVSREDFARHVEGWDVHPVTLDGQTVGAVLVKGPEIHACIAEGFGRWFRREQAAILNAVIDKHGYAQTQATTEAGIRFVQRLGFKKHGDSYRRDTKWELRQS